MFEGGFEISESKTKEYVAKGVYDKPDRPRTHTLEVREGLDEISRGQILCFGGWHGGWEGRCKGAHSAQRVDGFPMTSPKPKSWRSSDLKAVGRLSKEGDTAALFFWLGIRRKCDMERGRDDVGWRV